MNLSTLQSRTLDESRLIATESLREIRQSAANIADTMKSEVLHNTKMLRTVATLLENGLVLLDKDSRITVFNPAASSIFGVDPAEAVGKTFDQLFPSLARRFSDAPDSIQDIHTLDDRGRSGVVNLSFARMEGDTGDQTFSVLVASSQPQACRNVENCHVDMQQRLKEATELHSLTVWNFPMPAFFSDAEGNTIRGSKEFYSLMGRTPSQLNGRSVDELLPPAYLQWYFNTDEIAPLRMHLSTPQGVREFLAHRSAIRAENGKLIGFITCLVQQAQSTAETGFVTSFIKTIDALTTPLMLVSFSEGRVLLVNRAFCDKFHFERSDIINTNATALLSGGDFARLRRTMTSSLAKGKESLGRFRIKDAMGNRVWLTTKAIAISTGLIEGKHPKYCLLTEC